MFKPFIGDCVNKECGRTGVIIPVRSGLCQYCNYEKKQKSKKNSGNTSFELRGTDNEERYEEDSDGKQGDRKNYVSAYRSSNSFSRNTTFNKSRKSPTGEKEVFEEIAEEREWTCFVTGATLYELTATQFMHVLPKALNKYPLFKLYKPNIQLATNEAHYAWDFVPRSELKKDRRFDKLFELEEKLKEEYKLLKSSL